jgi:hypothetical protein
MKQKYFFTISDSGGPGFTLEGNPISNISGTWKLYCTEASYRIGQSLNITDFTLIQQGEFTTDLNGGFEHNSGNPIVVSTDYNTFLIILEVEGYKTSFRIYPCEIGFEKGLVPTNYSFIFALFTEAGYIEFKIDRLKDSLNNRFSL